MTTTALPRINEEISPDILDAHPSIVAVVDRDGDVWVKDGQVWSFDSPTNGAAAAAGYATPELDALSSDGLDASYGPLRVAWIWL